MATSSAERVSANTRPETNQRIMSDMQRRIEFYALHTDLIDQRLKELDREWDIERIIELQAPVETLLGIVMSVFGGRKWLLLPVFTQAMVLTHAVQGHFPTMPLMRAAGFRTQREMAEERYALRALRGDFDEAIDATQGEGERASAAFVAARIM